MGCDIHIYAESRDENGEWQYLGEIDFWRDYYAFGLLANGVRGNYGPFDPRGVPEDTSLEVYRKYSIKAVAKERHEALRADAKEKGYPQAHEYNDVCEISHAGAWVKNGYSRWKNLHGETRVSGPDWHHPSWLTAQEVKDLDPGKRNAQISALLADMLDIGAHRIVFWFDN